mmetsp:Transcript_8665/g.26019  ORF Transcript_8665/g.26019 Transcript_8665/m.26019 type:complete len:370 (+) Transcript_8665:595-1704(+)
MRASTASGSHRRPASEADPAATICAADRHPTGTPSINTTTAATIAMGPRCLDPIAADRLRRGFAGPFGGDDMYDGRTPPSACANPLECGMWWAAMLSQERRATLPPAARGLSCAMRSPAVGIHASPFTISCGDPLHKGVRPPSLLSAFSLPWSSPPISWPCSMTAAAPPPAAQAAVQNRPREPFQGSHTRLAAPPQARRPAAAPSNRAPGFATADTRPPARAAGAAAGSRASNTGTASAASPAKGDARLPSGRSRSAKPMRSASSHAAEKVAAVAILAWEAPSRASGSSSANTIHTIHPAAKPSAMGSSALKALTNINAGTATSACGRLVRTAQIRAWRAPTPRATNEVATARPSGMLCSPMARVTSTP